LTARKHARNTSRLLPLIMITGQLGVVHQLRVGCATCYRAIFTRSTRSASRFARVSPFESSAMLTSAETTFIVETQVVTFPSLTLDCGVTLMNVDVAYETYGTLNTDRSNAILVLHAFSGDAHAAGISKETGQPGWWSPMIGPGLAFDTDRHFVISSNVLGGCRGTTGPGSIDPAIGERYAMRL